MHLGLEFEGDQEVSKRRFERKQSCLVKMRIEWTLPRIFPMVTLLLTVLDVARKTEIINTYKILSKYPKCRNIMNNFVVEGKMILKWISKE